MPVSRLGRLRLILSMDKLSHKQRLADKALLVLVANIR